MAWAPALPSDPLHSLNALGPGGQLWLDPEPGRAELGVRNCFPKEFGNSKSGTRAGQVVALKAQDFLGKELPACGVLGNHPLGLDFCTSGLLTDGARLDCAGRTLSRPAIRSPTCQGFWRAWPLLHGYSRGCLALASGHTGPWAGLEVDPPACACPPPFSGASGSLAQGCPFPARLGRPLLRTVSQGSISLPS